MRRVITQWSIVWALVCAAFPPALYAADGMSGTWMTTAGPTRTFVFKVSQDTFTGLLCGPCDDPASVFRIQNGKIMDAARATFSVQYDERIETMTATLSGSQLTLRAERENGAAGAVPTVLRRVVENGVSVATKIWTLTATAGSTPRSPAGRVAHPIEGKWVANGRLAQQNFVLKVDENRLWGLVCGPCDPDGVFLIDDGTIDGDRLVFYINHIDTPPSPRPTGLNRNIMRGTRVGNVMKFAWVREGRESEPGGEMVLIGPIR